LTIVIIVIVLSVLIDLLIYWFKPEFLWFVPVAAILISGYLFVKDVNSYISEPSFTEKWFFYFHNDASMSLYLLYLPLVVLNIIAAVVLYLIKYIKRRSG